MSVGIEPTTVAVAGPVMAQALGLSWENDRTEVIQGLNDYRNDLYNFYSELKLFNDVFHCICIQTLPMQCTGACSEGQTFQGFALPSDVQAIETAWESNQPLKIRSRWRESHTGRGQGATSRIEIIELPEQVPTERPLKAISKLQVFGEHADDEGKGVAIEIVDIYGKRKVVLIPIRSQVWSKGMDSVKQILSVGDRSSIPTFPYRQQLPFRTCTYPRRQALPPDLLRPRYCGGWRSSRHPLCWFLPQVQRQHHRRQGAETL